MAPQASGNQNDGFVAIVSVLVIGAIGVTLAISLLWGGAGNLKTAMVFTASRQARALADACAEYALSELRQSTSYTGSETLLLGNGTCEVGAIGGSGNTNRTVQTTGTVGAVVRRVEVEVAVVSPTMTLTSWQEVASF